MEELKGQQLLTKDWFDESPPSATGGDREGTNNVNFSNGKVEAESALRDKVVALYFAANWCPASQEFTPLLKDLYEELERRGAPFEVVFIPFDKTKEDMEEYYLNKHADWLTPEFGDPIIEKLKSKYAISAIPKLVVLKPEGEVITMKGRKEVQDKGVVCFRNWINATNLKGISSPVTEKRASSRNLLSGEAPQEK